MKTVSGTTEDGVVVGNVFDKYGSRNPVVRWMMHGFESQLSRFVAAASPRSIHEVGCGEGYWVLRWLQQGIAARGCDFSSQVIATARANAARLGIDDSVFAVRSIYQLDAAQDRADLVVCCEVLEHLTDPENALATLQRVVHKDLILSVPREPLWRALNLARGKYVRHAGNTPGHLQHWSRQGFVELVGRYFAVVETSSPLPWTMLHCKARR